MVMTLSKDRARKKRHQRVRKKIRGDAQKPRLNIYRSLKHIYAQIIDDSSGHTLVSASTNSSAFKEKNISSGNIEAARLLGEILAEKALQQGIEQVVFDRGGFLYHGRVKALAEGARNKGLKF